MIKIIIMRNLLFVNILCPHLIPTTMHFFAYIVFYIDIGDSSYKDNKKAGLKEGGERPASGADRRALSTNTGAIFVLRVGYCGAFLLTHCTKHQMQQLCPSMIILLTH